MLHYPVLGPRKNGGFLGGKSCERGFRTLEADVEPGFSPLSVLLPPFRTSEKEVAARRNLATESRDGFLLALTKEMVFGEYVPKATAFG